jgi:hypothetical protein
MGLRLFKGINGSMFPSLFSSEQQGWLSYE